MSTPSNRKCLASSHIVEYSQVRQQNPTLGQGKDDKIKIIQILTGHQGAYHIYTAIRWFFFISLE